MASPQVYDRNFIYAGGKLLGESDSVTIEYQGSPLPVATFAKDFAGVTPTPKMVRITVESFVPQKGFEFDAIDKFLKTERVVMQSRFGGSTKTMKTEGFVDAPSIRSSASENTKLTFSFMGEAKVFQ